MAAESGAAYSPQHRRQQQQQQQRPASQQQSVSLSLGRRTCSGIAQASPSLLAAVSAATATAAARSGGPGSSGGSSVGGGDGLDGDDADSQSMTHSASIGDSFTFNQFRGLNKLHDD